MGNEITLNSLVVDIFASVTGRLPRDMASPAAIKAFPICTRNCLISLAIKTYSTTGGWNKRYPVKHELKFKWIEESVPSEVPPLQTALSQ